VILLLKMSAALAASTKVSVHASDSAVNVRNAFVVAAAIGGAAVRVSNFGGRVKKISKNSSVTKIKLLIST